MNKKTTTLIFVTILLVSLVVSNVSAAGCCLNTQQRSYYCQEVELKFCCPLGSPADCSKKYFFTGSDCTDKNECIGDNVGCCCDDEGSSSPRDPDYKALCTDEGWTFNFPYPLFQTCSQFCGGLPPPTDECVGLNIDDCQNNALGGGPCRWTYTNFDQDPDTGECNTGCKDDSYLESRGNVFCYPKCEVGKQIKDVGKTCVCTAGDFEKSATNTGYCCEGGYQTDPCSVAPPNNPPKARFTAPIIIQLGETIDFDATTSTDSDGTINTYSWSFGDGSTGSGVTTSHTYTKAGTYTVTLTVTDNGGETGTYSKAIKVTVAGALVVNIEEPTPPVSGTAPFTVDFRGSATGGTSPYSYSWQFGDGSTGSGVTTSHTYTTAGTYTVTLRVGDNSIPKQEVDKFISVTVTEPVEPTKFSINPSTDTISVGDTTQLTAQNAPGDVTWSTSDEGIATVNDNGLVTGKGEGTATITATSDGQTATAEITVTELEEDWIIISGVVRDALDPKTVLKDIHVTADNAETVITDDKGMYTIKVPTGTLYLSFYDPSRKYLPARYYISTSSSPSNPITGSVVETISGADVKMRKAECIAPLAEDDSDEKKYAPEISVTRSATSKKLTITLVAPTLEGPNKEIPLSYRIYKCNNDACTESATWYLIHEIQQGGSLTYIDTEAVFGEFYTYAASAVYDTLESVLAIAKYIEEGGKITLGYIECKDKTQRDIGNNFCYNNIQGNCDSDFKFEPGEVCLENGKVCIDNECEPREEKCKEALFGIYYSGDLDKNTFFDVSKTIVDTCYECKKIIHCNDYKSKKACEDDRCSVGGDEYGHGKNCGWKSINEELGIGVCINKKSNNCRLCSERNTEAPNEPAYNEIFQKCTEEKAGKLSTSTNECRFIDKESKAKSCKEMSCYDYGRKSGIDGCGDTTALIDPLTNEITPKSDDKCGIGMCRFYSGECVKITDRTLYQAAVVYKSSCNELEGEAKKKCEKDRTPPKTVVGTSYNFYEGLINKDASIYFTVVDDSDFVETYFCIDHIKDNIGDKPVRENTCDPHPNKDGCFVDYKFGEKTGLYLGKTVCEQKTSYLKDLNKITAGYNTIRFYSKDRANNLEVVKTFYFEISDPTLKLAGEGCDKDIKNCFKDTVTSMYDETDEKYKSTVTIEFETNNYAKCEYWTSITTEAGLEHQQDKDEMCFSKEHTATFENIEGGTFTFYFKIYCDNGLESEKISFGPYKIYIGANKAIGNVKPSGIIPSKDNLLLEFDTKNYVECKWQKHEADLSITNYNDLKGLYNSIPNNQKFTAKEITKQEGKAWHHTFNNLDPIVVNDGKYIFDIVCDNQIVKDALGKIEFTLDTTAPEKIKAKISEEQPRAGENFDFEVVHTPQSITLECIDPPTKQEGTDIISIGYGCSVGYCVLNDGKIINGDGVIVGDECEPSEPDLTEGKKDIVTIEEISETSKICYKAIENLPEDVEPRGKQRECNPVRIADKPSRPVYEIQELTELPPGVLKSYTKLGKKDEISYTEEGKTTRLIKLSEGYYKLKITAENLREKPKLYLIEYEKHEITIPNDDFIGNKLNLELFIHIFEYQITNEKRLGLNIFETTEEIQNYRLKDYDGEVDMSYKRNGVEDVTFKLVAYDLTEGHDPEDTINPDSEGNYIEAYANYDVDNKPPEEAAITSILKSEDEETRIEITDIDEIYKLVIKDEKVTVEGSVSEDGHLVKLYKSKDDVYQSTDTLVGQPFEVKDNTFGISIQAVEFNDKENYLFAVVEDSVGNWKVSEEKVIVYKTLNPITASLTVANQDWKEGIIVGQFEEVDKIVPLSVRIEASAGLDKSLDSFKIKICHDNICEEPNEDGWLTELPELKENNDGSYTADYNLKTNLQDNAVTYTSTVYVKDNSGNELTKVWSFIVDPQLPVLQDWTIPENDGKFNENDKKIYAKIEKPAITVNFGTTGKNTKITHVKIYEKDTSVIKLDRDLEEYDSYEIKPDSELEDEKTYIIEVKARKKLSTGYGSEGSYTINLVADRTYPDVKDIRFKVRCISGITYTNHIPDCDSGFEYSLRGEYDEMNIEEIKLIIDSDEKLSLTGLETQPFIFEPIGENLFDSGTEIKFIIGDKAGNKKEIILNQIKEDTTDLTFSGFSNNLFYTKNTPIFLKGTGVAKKDLKIKNYDGLGKGSKEIDLLGEFSIETKIEQNSDNNLIAYLFKDDELYFRKINIIHDDQPPNEIDRYPKTITPEIKPKIYIKLKDFSGIDGSSIKFYLAETGRSLRDTDLKCSGSACVSILPDRTYEVSYTPTTDLTFGQSYTVRVEGIKDLTGNSLNPIEWSFTIDDGAPILKTAKLIRGTDEVPLFADGEGKGAVTNKNSGEIELVYEGEVDVLIETNEGTKDSIILTGPTSLIPTKRIYKKDGNKITFKYFDIGTLSDGAYTLKVRARKDIVGSSWDEKNIMFTIDTQPPQAGDLIINIDGIEVSTTDDPKKQFTATTHQITVSAKDYSLGEGTNIVCNDIKATGALEDKEGKKQWSTNLDLSTLRHDTGVNCVLDVYDRAGNHDEIPLHGLFKIDSEGPEFTVKIKNIDGTDVPSAGDFLNPQKKKISYGHYHLTIQSNEELKALPTFKLNGVDVAVIDTSSTGPWNFYMWILKKGSANYFVIIQQNSDWSSSVEGAVESRGAVTDGSDLNIYVSGWDKALTNGNQREKTDNNYKVDLKPPTPPTIDWIRITGLASRVDNPADIPSKYLYIKDQTVDFGATLNDLDDVATIKLYLNNVIIRDNIEKPSSGSTISLTDIANDVFALGKNYLFIEVLDAVNNKAQSEPVVVLKDTKEPVITINAPKTGVTVSSGDELDLDAIIKDVNEGNALAAGIDEDSICVKVKDTNSYYGEREDNNCLTGPAFADNKLSHDFSDLADLEEGTYTLTIEASDKSGNVKHSEITFKINKELPDNPEIEINGDEFDKPDKNVENEYYVNRDIQELELSFGTNVEFTNLIINEETIPLDAESIKNPIELNDGREIEIRIRSSRITIQDIDPHFTDTANFEITAAKSFETGHGPEATWIITIIVDKISPEIEIDTEGIEPHHVKGGTTYISVSSEIPVTITDNILLETCQYNAGKGWQDVGCDGSEYIDFIINDIQSSATQIKIKAIDIAGNEVTETVAVVIDSTAPQTTAAIEAKALNNWYNSDVTVTLGCGDSGSGCAETYCCVDQDNKCEPFEDDECEPTISGAKVGVYEDGINYVRYYSIDNLENKENVKEKIVKIDQTPPEPTEWKPAANDVVKNRKQPIAVTLNDAGSGIQCTGEKAPKLVVNNLQRTITGCDVDGQQEKTITFTPDFNWVEGEGTITVTINDLVIYDVMGNRYSLPSPLTFTVNTNNPLIELGTTRVESGDYVNVDTNIIFVLFDFTPDDYSTLGSVTLNVKKDGGDISSEFSLDPVNPVQDYLGDAGKKYKFIKKSGNLQPGSYELSGHLTKYNEPVDWGPITFVIDNTAPTSAYISINSGAPHATNAESTLTLSAEDDLSKVDEVAVIQKDSQPTQDEWDGMYWVDYSNYDPILNPYYLTGFDGEKTVYARFKNKVGLESDAVSDSIILDTTPPILTKGDTTPAENTPVNVEEITASWVTDSNDISEYNYIFTEREITEEDTDVSKIKEAIKITDAATTSITSDIRYLVPSGEAKTIYLYVQAEDNVGNFGTPIKYTFIIDRKAPTATEWSPVGTIKTPKPTIFVVVDGTGSQVDCLESNIQLFISADENNDAYDYDNQPYTERGYTVSCDGSTGAITFNPGLNLITGNEGTISLRLTVKDAAGNQGILKNTFKINRLMPDIYLIGEDEQQISQQSRQLILENNYDQLKLSYKQDLKAGNIPQVTITKLTGEQRTISATYHEQTGAKYFIYHLIDSENQDNIVPYNIEEAKYSLSVTAVNPDDTPNNLDNFRFTIDNTPPEVQEINVIPGRNGVISALSTISAEVDDTGSGVDKCYYTLDGVRWLPSGGFNYDDIYGTCEITVNTKTVSSINIKAADYAGNFGEGVPLQVEVDKSPPITTATIESAVWYNYKPITVTLTAVDRGIGVDYIKYCTTQSLDCDPDVEGQTINGETGQVQITAEGITRIRYYAVDNVANIEGVKESIVQIDTKGPILVPDSQTPTSTIGDTTPVVSAYIEDDTSAKDVSGLDRSNIMMNICSSGTDRSLICTDGIKLTPDANGKISYTFDSGLSNSDSQVTYTVRIKAQDNAGNQMEASWSFTIDPLAPTGTIGFDPPLIENKYLDVGIAKAIATFDHPVTCHDANQVEDTVCELHLDLVDDKINIEFSATRIDTGVQGTIHTVFIVDTTDPVINQLTAPEKTADDTPDIIIDYTEMNIDSITAVSGNSVTANSGLRSPYTINTLQLIPNRNNEIRITLTDKTEKTATDTVTVYVDTKPPEITLFSTTDKTKDPPFKITYKLDEDATIQFFINEEPLPIDRAIKAGTRTKSLTFLGDGIKTIKATAVDEVGNSQDSNELQILYDTGPPTITEIIPQDGSRLSSLQVVRVKLIDIGAGVDLDNSEVSVTPVGCTKSNDREYLTCTFARPLKEIQTQDVQEYAISVEAKDILGNAAGEKTFTFTIDKNSPIITFTNPIKSPYYTNIQTQTITGTITTSDNSRLTSSQYKINDEAYEDLTLTGDQFLIPYNLPEPIGAASYTTTRITVKGIDNLERYAEDYVSLLYDPTSPIIDITTTTTETGADSITIQGTYSENTGLEHLTSITAEIEYYDGTKSTPIVNYASGTFTFKAILIVDPGVGHSDNIITVTVTDEAGNRATDTITITKQAQLNAPLLNVIKTPTCPNKQPITITGTSDINTDVELYINYVKRQTKHVPMGRVTGFDTISFDGTNLNPASLNIVEGRKVKFQNNAEVGITINGFGKSITVGASSTSDEISLAEGTYNYNVKIGESTITSGTITVSPQSNAFQFDLVNLNGLCTINGKECHIYVKAVSSTEGVNEKESAKQIVVYDKEPPTLGTKTPSAARVNAVPPVISVVLQDNEGVDWNSVIVNIREGQADTTLTKDTYTINTETGLMSLVNPSAHITLPPEGEEKTYTIIIEADDLAGNTMSAPWQIMIDRLAPTITATIIDAVMGARLYLYKAEHKVSVTASEDVRCKYGIDTAEWNSMIQFEGFEDSYAKYSMSNNLGMISLGEHILYVICEDALGNRAEQYEIDFTFTNKVPIYDLAPDGASNSLTPQLGVKTAVESNCKVYIDNKWEDMHTSYGLEHTYQTGTLTDGEHNFNVKCTDPSGKLGEGTATISFIIDKTPPEKPTITSPPTGIILGSTPVRITIKVFEDNAAVKIYKQGYEVNARDATLISDKTRAFEVTDFALSPGSNVVVARAYDQAGNPSEESDPITIIYIANPPGFSSMRPADGTTRDRIDNIEVDFSLEPQQEIDVSATTLTLTKQSGTTPTFTLTKSAMDDNTIRWTLSPSLIGETKAPSATTINGVYNAVIHVCDTITPAHCIDYTKTITIDGRVPNVKITSPVPGRINNGHINLQGTATSTEFDMTSIIVNSDGATVCIPTIENPTTTIDCEFDVTTEGPHTITAIATNNIGDGSDTINVELDTTGPPIKLEQTYYGQKQSLVPGIVPEQNPTIVIRTDNGGAEEAIICKASYAILGGIQRNNVGLTKDTTDVMKHTVLVTEKLEENVDIPFTFTCYDDLDNPTIPAFITNIKIDTLNPTITDFGLAGTAIKIGEAGNKKDYVFYQNPIVEMRVTTSEETKCKFSETDESYDTMPYIFQERYSTTNIAQQIVLNDGDDKTYYIVCMDKAGRTSSKVMMHVRVNIGGGVLIYDGKIDDKALTRVGTTLTGITNNPRPVISLRTDITSVCTIDAQYLGITSWLRDMLDPAKDMVTSDNLFHYYPPSPDDWTKEFAHGDTPQFIITCDDSPDTGRGEATETISFVVDTRPPEKPIITTRTQTIGIGTIIITGTAEPSSTVTVVVEHEDGTKETFAQKADSEGTFRIDVTLEEGINKITSKATDAAGNTGEESDPITITYIAEVPVYSYIIPENKDVLNSIEAIEIGWAKDEPIDSASIVVTRIEDLEGNSLSDNIEMHATREDNVFTFTPTKELTNGVYSIEITATDTFEHITTFPLITFTIDNRIPIIEVNIITPLTEDRRTKQKNIAMDISVDGNGYGVSELTVNDIYVPTTGEVIFNVKGYRVDLDKEGSNVIVIKAANERGTARNTLQPVIRDTIGAPASIIIED